MNKDAEFVGVDDDTFEPSPYAQNRNGSVLDPDLELDALLDSIYGDNISTSNWLRIFAMKLMSRQLVAHVFNFTTLILPGYL
jgi:hypothetical protein